MRKPSRTSTTDVATLLLVLAAAAILVSGAGLGCASQQTAGLTETAEADAQEPMERQTVELPLTSFAFDPMDPSYRFFDAYRISPGDVLDVLYQIRTWQEQDEFRLTVDHVISVKFTELPHLDEEERIRPDGRISLPYLGEVYVVGKTVRQLTDELRERYSAILKSPNVYVTVPEFRSAIKELKSDLHTAPRGLSRLVTVRPDGYATFAMLGDIRVVDRTVPEVANELNELYDQIIPGLGVDLFLEKHSGRRVYVLGDVAEPGSYSIQKPTTVVEALALAGSHLPTADIGKVAVVRRRGDKMVGTLLDVKKTLSLSGKGEFFFLKPDDLVYVPRRPVTRWADVSRDIADLLFFRGWGFDIDGN